MTNSFTAIRAVTKSWELGISPVIMSKSPLDPFIGNKWKIEPILYNFLAVQFLHTNNCIYQKKSKS